MRRAFAGVVLAGGGGRRFGGPKAWVADDDGWWLTAAVAALRPWCGADIVVATRPEVGAPHVGQRATTHDAVGLAGPLGGLLTVLAATRARDLLVLPVDLGQPAAALEALAIHPSGAPVVGVVDGRVHPLACRVPVRRAELVARGLAARGERRAGRLHDLLGSLAVSLPPPVTDRNHPGDARSSRLDQPGPSTPGPSGPDLRADRSQRGRMPATTL